MVTRDRNRRGEWLLGGFADRVRHGRARDGRCRRPGGDLAEIWRPIAMMAAVVSLIGIGLFLGTWPTFNTLAAIAVNTGLLASLLMGR
jgi:hypothetical protein